MMTTDKLLLILYMKTRFMNPSEELQLHTRMSNSFYIADHIQPTLILSGPAQ